MFVSANHKILQLQFHLETAALCLLSGSGTKTTWEKIMFWLKRTAFVATNTSNYPAVTLTGVKTLSGTVERIS